MSLCALLVYLDWPGGLRVWRIIICCLCTLKTTLVQTNLPEYQGPEKIVIRRYSDFVWLHDRLFENYKGIFIPPLPEKSAVGNKSINTSVFVVNMRSA